MTTIRFIDPASAGKTRYFLFGHRPVRIGWNAEGHLSTRCPHTISVVDMQRDGCEEITGAQYEAIRVARAENDRQIAVLSEQIGQIRDTLRTDIVRILGRIPMYQDG